METRTAPIIEEYGPLSGLRVLLSGHAVAGPCACRWMGDMGAEIVKIELPGLGDMSRMGPRQQQGEVSIVPKWVSLARNAMSIEMQMNFNKFPESKKVFVDLIKQVDIWINSIPGIDKHGPTDEIAMEANPKLVIVHVTGFGLPQSGGTERYLGRSCFDTIGQAFSGVSTMQGMPDGPVVIMNPTICDLISSMSAAFAGLAGYINMKKTGKGQIVDNSMYESMAYALNFHWLTTFGGMGSFERHGNVHELYQPFGFYDCKEGRITVCVLGPNIWDKLMAALGTSTEEFPYAESCTKTDPVIAKKFSDFWYAWLAEHTAKEVEELFLKHDIPVMPVQSIAEAGENPHWIARNDFIEIKDEASGAVFKDLGPMPKFLDTPGKVWRGGPRLGQDTDTILKEIAGYSEQEIEELKAKGAVASSNRTL